MYLDEEKKENCCGCMACAHVCPVAAIQMKTDAYGFCYPEIDPEKCIHCNLCRKVCPLNENLVGQDADPTIYAVQNKDVEVLPRSSSGGMFSLLADWILEQGGVIYGVAFDDDFTVMHLRAATKEEAARFCTSKYVESDPSAIYRTIREDFAAKKPVLLTGTPCQIAGVTSWLRAKQIDTEMLYTCDNICHGVPSPMAWKDYLNILREKYIDSDDEIVSVNMRSKSVSWEEQKFEITLKNGDVNQTVEEMSFNQLFKTLLLHRPSCFDCHFTSYNRISDFTLGDFWNAKNAGLQFDINDGVNEVLINTVKGRRLFEQIQNNANVQSISKQEAWQLHLECSPKKPKGYDKFWEEYRNTPDKEALIRKNVKGSFVTRMIHTLSPVLRKTGLYNLAGKLYRVVFVRKKAE